MLDETMTMKKAEAPKYDPLPQDIYQLELLDVSAKVGKKYMSSEDETTLSFHFGVVDKEDKGLRGRSVWLNFVPTSLFISRKTGEKNKLYAVVEAILKRELKPEEVEDGITGAQLNGLIGKQCRSFVSKVQKGEKVYNNPSTLMTSEKDCTPLTAEEKEKLKPKAKNPASEAQLYDAPPPSDENIPF